jgi:hypothetical protein
MPYGTRLLGDRGTQCSRASQFPSQPPRACEGERDCGCHRRSPRRSYAGSRSPACPPLIGCSPAPLLSEPSLLPDHKHDGSTNWAFRAGELAGSTCCWHSVTVRPFRFRLAAADASGRPHSLGFSFLTLSPFLRKRLEILELDRHVPDRCHLFICPVIGYIGAVYFSLVDGRAGNMHPSSVRSLGNLHL